MEAKTKAQEIINKFLFRKYDYVDFNDAKECARMTVEMIMSECNNPITYKYWNDVSKEIEKYTQK